jgi:hypothetical protein
MISHANGIQKKAAEAILISDKMKFKSKAVKSFKRSHYTMIEVN